MATAGSTERSARARMAARRRAARARIVAAAAGSVAAWCGHAAMAVQSSDRQPLGPALPPAAGSGGGWELLRLAVSLAVVVGLALAARWWIRRSGVAARLHAGPFDIVARQSVGRGEHVLVARFGPRLLCIHQGRGGMRTLSELSAPAEVASALADCRGQPAAPDARTVDLRRGREQGT